MPSVLLGPDTEFSFVESGSAQSRLTLVLARGLISAIRTARGDVNTARVTSLGSTPCHSFSALALSGNPSYAFTNVELVPRNAFFGFVEEGLLAEAVLLLLLPSEGNAMLGIDGSETNGFLRLDTGEWPGIDWAFGLLSYEDAELDEEA